jgi:AcrR family transcriptional regulator
VPKVSQAHLDRRRQEILDGARRCFARFGYEGATVRRLEREIGLSRGAIFNYFPTKWELFLELAVQEYERSPESWSGGGFEERARSIVEEDSSWLAVHFEFARRVRTEPVLRERLMRRFPEGRRRVLESLVEGQQAGEFRADVSTDTLRNFLAFFLDGLAFHVSLGGTVDLDDVLKLVDDAVRPAAAATTTRSSASARARS